MTESIKIRPFYSSLLSSCSFLLVVRFVLLAMVRHFIFSSCPSCSCCFSCLFVFFFFFFFFFFALLFTFTLPLPSPGPEFLLMRIPLREKQNEKESRSTYAPECIADVREVISNHFHFDFIAACFKNIFDGLGTEKKKD